MKRFLTICILIFLIGIVAFGSFISNDVFAKNKTYFVKTKGKDIYIAKNDKWRNLKIVGVDLNSTKPGVFPSENMISEEEYLRWISYIYDMGANCIKVSHTMDASFYDALHKFNKDKKNPIYLMQGIYFDEKLLKNGKNPEGKTASEAFQNNIKVAIDSVHGNLNNLKKSDIFEKYKTDVSKYVIGYSLGIEFAKHDIIYADIMNQKSPYNGKYMYTNKDASSFESYLASMGDYLTKYEFAKYKKQSLISFIGTSPSNIINNKSSKDEKEIKNFVDVSNIKRTRSLKTGIVASYNIYPSFTDLKEYQGNMDEYFKKINDHYKIPVIIGEMGVPSSRAGGDFNKDVNKGYITEQEQGKALVSAYRAIKKSGISGCFIFEFQDSWASSSWNTKDSKILDRSAYWSDAQTYSQSFGLMDFEPGKVNETPYPDDSLSDWNNSDILNQNDKLSLYAKSDDKYLYLMVKSQRKLNLKKEGLYIDLDVTPKSGSNKSTQYNLKFDKPVDFIISINDNKNSMVSVHEYYNRFNFYENKTLYEQRPDLIKNTPDMDYFSPIYMDIRPKMYVKSLNETLDKISYETGKLTKGNGNPNSKNYNSATDYYIGDNYVEVRIPWGLINFMDPSTKQIQDDFYKEFKTKPLRINNINIGATVKEENKTINRLNSKAYNLKGWNVPEYHERLKQSYYIVKDELKK
ncbi:MAG: hypothetical protein KH369_01710 [Paraclostridium bifermentans]|uniref:hypothetical protein n=1 Tax=Paraclostridium bifermentans TaxID=1490 RepID=UPI0011DE1631|nr:hypothetical protein [Paraclostridium bifermentans]MBS6506881.1 hypothetical protein [Paraclostridium bifermentans]MDU3801932.1 hypothetical protein [Paraclostridium bifermentans]